MSKKPDLINIYIGDMLYAFRNMRSLSQKEIANIIRVSKKDIQKYETAKINIPACHLLRISRALQQPITSFLPDYFDDPWDE